MKKDIVIAGCRRRTLQVFADQLYSLFGSDLNIKLLEAGEPVTQTFGKGCIVMVQSYGVFREIRSRIDNSDVILIRTTLQTGGIKQLTKIPKNRPVLVAGDSMEIAQEFLNTLLQLGFRHEDMHAADLSNKKIFKGKTVVIAGVPPEEIPGAGMIINVNRPVLDITTILDIGIRLDRKDLLLNENIVKNFIEFQPLHDGITWGLENSNSLNSSVRILLDVIDGAVVSVDQGGLIRKHNDRVEPILGVDHSDILGRNGLELFPEIPFRDVMEGKPPIVESLRTINDESMVVSVKPIFNSGKRYGAIAVVKRFNDEESRQHKLRTLLMGKGYRAKYRFRDIMGESSAMTQCKSIAQRMAASNSSVLIIGETGTGKEMFAQAIHNASSRKPYQFVAVNCGAIPESLLESELFGYEEGAFTGARKGGKLGFFELAHKGTLFFDEISEMSKTLQKRLLRVLQEREVTRLGGNSVIHVDVRVIAATNRDLRAMTKAGDFRDDLYYRLSILPLKIPPLRDRWDDIRTLAQFFRDQLGGSFRLTEAAWRELERYRWPGNVRELRNYMEYFTNLPHPVIGINELAQIVPLYDSVCREDYLFEERQEQSRKEELDEHEILVLKILKDGLEQAQRLGRRSVSSLAGRQGVFLGEQEIRRILNELKGRGLVEIRHTKAGTVITSKGIAALKVIE